jgi:hypothetical protein
MQPSRLAAIAATACAALACCSTLPARAQAQDNARWMRECHEWIEKKGYSVDYIEQRTGERPMGNMAQNWIGTLDPKQAQVGDIVFLRIDGPGGNSAQRAEVVEAVLRHEDGSVRAFRTSSMNHGKLIEPHCQITENFGKVTRHVVPVDQVLRARHVEPR